MNIFGKPARIASVLLASTVLVACDNLSIPDFSGGPAPVSSVSRPTPDARGVISYGTYQVMVASPGDTLASMAQRVGIPSEDLARHNGLPVSYVPRPGENLALPRTVDGALASNASGWTSDIAISAIDKSVNTQTGSVTTSEPSANLDGEPIRHRVDPGETAYSIARLYNVSVT
ncbi:MAG: LysM peptidoglycan-binding domain-containing protein, partial [Alphaproteobacteria bacterium]